MLLSTSVKGSRYEYPARCSSPLPGSPNGSGEIPNRRPLEGLPGVMFGSTGTSNWVYFVSARTPARDSLYVLEDSQPMIVEMPARGRKSPS